MTINFTKEDRKKVKVKEITLKTENIFAPCKRCDRPYHKGKKYPNEVCKMCEAEIEWNVFLNAGEKLKQDTQKTTIIRT